ncbi:hypothetical protein D3C87_1434460 [compost metagenome]
MKRASRWRFERAWNFTGNQFPVTARRVDIGNGLQQKLGIGVTRAGEQLLRVALLHNAAKIHDRDAIRHVANHAHVMADEQIGQPQLVLKASHQVQHLRLHRYIECRCRLVTDQKLGLTCQSAGNGDALTLAA